MNCLRCGHSLKKDETELCQKCYEEFEEWSSRRFIFLAKKKENPIELWLKEAKNHDRNQTETSN